MKHNVVRLESIEIRNFKNVKCGSLSFENTRKPYSASILGLYGQNGSGKTALIDALSLLKHLLMGQQIPPKFAECINVDSTQASFCFSFQGPLQRARANGVLLSPIRAASAKTPMKGAANMEQAPKWKVTVFNEVLSASFKSDGQKKQVFTPGQYADRRRVPAGV